VDRERRGQLSFCGFYTPPLRDHCSLFPVCATVLSHSDHPPERLDCSTYSLSRSIARMATHGTGEIAKAMAKRRLMRRQSGDFEPGESIFACSPKSNGSIDTLWLP
jgi:hypothetical protein